jgi:hypothetical protein
VAKWAPASFFSLPKARCGLGGSTPVGLLLIAGFARQINGIEETRRVPFGTARQPRLHFQLVRSDRAWDCAVLERRGNPAETPRKCVRKSMGRDRGQQLDTAAEPSGSRGHGHRGGWPHSSGTPALRRPAK